MSKILLDTHALIWLLEGNPKLGKNAQITIDAAMRADSLYISAISFWEIAHLTKRGKIEISQSLEAWRRQILALGIQEIPLEGDVAIQSVMLDGLHGDPADRMLAATAFAMGATLITADTKILEWEGALARFDAGK